MVFHQIEFWGLFWIGFFMENSIFQTKNQKNNKKQPKIAKYDFKKIVKKSLFGGPGGRGWVLNISLDAEFNFQLHGID